MSTPIITSPMFHRGSFKNNIYYHTSCYLTLGNIPCDKIANSTTYNGKTYHLLDTYYITTSNSIFAWMGTTIKVLSYCTIVIPVIALLLNKISQPRSLYFAKKSSYNYFSLEDLHQKNPEHLAILHRLVPDLFQTSLVKDACRKENIPFLKSVAEHSPNSLTETFTNFDYIPRVLQEILFDSKHKSLHPLLNPVYLTKVAQWNHTPNLKTLLDNNRDLWNALVTTKPLKDYCPSYLTDTLISQVYTELTRCAAENKPPLSLHPDIFSTRAHSWVESTTILALAFSHDNAELFSYLLTHYKESVLTKQSLEGFLEWLYLPSSRSCPLTDCGKTHPHSPPLTSSQNAMLSSLTQHAKTEILKLLPDYKRYKIKSNHPNNPVITQLLSPLDEQNNPPRYPKMEQLFTYNKKKWLEIVTTKSPKEYCSPQYHNLLIEQIYQTLRVNFLSGIQTDIKFHPDIFSLKQTSADNQTVFGVVFTHGDTNFFSYLLKNYQTHILSEPNLRSFVAILQNSPLPSSGFYTRYTTHSSSFWKSAKDISLEQEKMFKKLLDNKGTTLYDYFSREILTTMNRDPLRQTFVHWLHSTAHPYPLPSHLRLSQYNSPGGFNYTFGEPGSTGRAGASSSARHTRYTATSTQNPTISPNTISFPQFVKHLHTITKSDALQHPCSSQRSFDELYKKALDLPSLTSFQKNELLTAHKRLIRTNAYETLPEIMTYEDFVTMLKTITNQRNTIINSQKGLHRLFKQASLVTHPDKKKDNGAAMTNLTEAYNSIKKLREFRALPENEN